MAAGTIRYDASRVARVCARRFRYHHLPDREGRPGNRPPLDPFPEGLFRPHVECPFDGDDFVREREIARAERSGRVYHLTFNRFPVTPRHFLAIRPADAAPVALRQHLHGAEEIEDMAACVRSVGSGYRAYFNSSRGADGSQSGSSVHHWHFQLFAYEGDTPFEHEIRERNSRLVPPETESIAREDGVLCRSFPFWPARHRVFESMDDTALARVIWRRIEETHRRNAAYNLELRELAGGVMRAFLFPRHAAPDRVVEGVGRLSSNFGGWELSGDLVIPTSALLQWHDGHPAEAEQLTEDRLRETTFAPA